MLLIVKCMDYILTPMAGGALILQMHLKNRWNSVMMGLLALNTVLQLISSAIGGWMAAIDARNHYTHGPLYPPYMGLCLAIILIVIAQFIIYGRSFRRQNRASLYATMLLIVIGIAIQELSDARTSYTALTIGAALLFIHYTEFVSLKRMTICGRSSSSSIRTSSPECTADEPILKRSGTMTRRVRCRRELRLSLSISMDSKMSTTVWDMRQETSLSAEQRNASGVLLTPAPAATALAAMNSLS